MKGVPMLSVSVQSPLEEASPEYQYGILHQAPVCPFQFIETPANRLSGENTCPIIDLQEDSECLASPNSKSLTTWALHIISPDVPQCYESNLPKFHHLLIREHIFAPLKTDVKPVYHSATGLFTHPHTNTPSTYTPNT